jgi:hypothetical protein
MNSKPRGVGLMGDMGMFPNFPLEVVGNTKVVGDHN